MGRLVDAVKSGDKREMLLALQLVTAEAIEETTSGRDHAALSKRLIEITERIDALPNPNSENAIDALVAAIAEYEADDDEDG